MVWKLNDIRSFETVLSLVCLRIFLILRLKAILSKEMYIKRRRTRLWFYNDEAVFKDV